MTKTIKVKFLKFHSLKQRRLNFNGKFKINNDFSLIIFSIINSYLS